MHTVYRLIHSYCIVTYRQYYLCHPLIDSFCDSLYSDCCFLKTTQADIAHDNCQEERAKVAINRSVTCATIAFVIGAVVLATATAFACYLHYFN